MCFRFIEALFLLRRATEGEMKIRREDEELWSVNLGRVIEGLNKLHCAAGYNPGTHCYLGLTKLIR